MSKFKLFMSVATAQGLLSPYKIYDSADFSESFYNDLVISGLVNTEYSGKPEVIYSITPPANTDVFWVDTSVSPRIPKVYNSDSSTWESNSGGGGTIELSQITKLGVVGTTTEPHIITATIPTTTDFKRIPVEVLKFTPGTNDVVQTLATFDNGDASDFEANDQLVFDGSMKLKTSYSEPMVDDGVLGAGKQFSYVLDTTRFKKIESIGVTG